jgi:phospholipid-binding lipoprotein MlaA
MKTGSKIVAAVLLVAAMSGCATTRNNPVDPFEGFNRAVFSFNDGLDRVALKPVATVYQKVLPSFVQTGIGNFFGNLADVWTSVNNLLQGKVESGLNDMMRVVVNSTLGLGGVLDIGSEAGLQKHKEDFGQTLGVWGVKSGPYVVLPLLGSSTLRDTLATPIDFAGDPVSYAESSRGRIAANVLRVVDARANALGASSLVEDAAIDRYEFIRDAYLQRRESKIHDGESGPRKKDSLTNNESEKRMEVVAVESETVVKPVETPEVKLDASPVGVTEESSTTTTLVSSDPVSR